MKRTWLIAGVAALILIPIAAVFLSAIKRANDWRIDYAEAEPLVLQVWPLAHELKNFVEAHGRLPNDLHEIDSQTAKDFSSLQKYHPKLTEEAGHIFFLRVNERFAFDIDSDFNPEWAEFAEIFSPRATKQDQPSDA